MAGQPLQNLPCRLPKQARDAWALLWALLRHEAWQPGAVFADEAVRLGREHQAEVGSLLGLQVPRAVESLLQGALDHPDNAAVVGDGPDRRELLRELYPGALRFLYRVLFVLYAESRGLLPLDMPTYRDGYALTGGNGLVRRALNPATDPRRVPAAATGFYEDSLRALFALLREGADLGPEGRIPAYGGGLFHTHPEDRINFDSLRLGDATIASVLQFLTRVETKAGLVTLSYRELDVEQLGSLYEGLLERSVDYADEPLWRIRLDGDVVLVTESQRQDLRRRRGETGYAAPDPEDEDEDDERTETTDEETEDEEDTPSTGKKKPIRILPSEEGAPNPIPPGSVVLRAGAGRKQSGSYYTSRAFVDYLVREAVDPLARGKKPEEILRLKVCDPAMGSGHFLVGACRRLAEHLLAAYRAAVETERERVEAAGREPRTHELLLDAGVHPDVARVWQTKSPSGDEADLVACRLLVAGYCIYGVDKNRLAVELARVSLWLATAASDHPLTFLDHRLVCGDSLLGLTVEQLLRPFTDKLKVLRKAPALTGETGDKQIPLGVSRTDLDSRMRRAFHWLNEIQRIEAERPGDFADQQTAFQTMQQELADFIDAHRLRVGRAFFDEGHPAWAPEVFNDWLTEIHQFGTPSQELRDKAAEGIHKGKSEGVRAFCWELAFPEVYFEPDPDSDGIRRRAHRGFDAVIGNPPWDKVRPFQKEFFAQFDPAIGDFQGQTLKRRVSQLAPPGSEALERWDEYNVLQTRLAQLLLKGGVYVHQVVEVGGEKTGGDPDLSKFFIERDFQLVREGGRVGVLLPAGLYALEGATGLRQMLLGDTRVEALYSFENWSKRFFPIHPSFKFVTLVLERTTVDEQSFPAAFMLRDEGFLGLPEPERLARSVTITTDLIRRTNPAYLSIIELRDDREREFVERIYRDVPPLAQKIEGEGTWNVEFHRELDMTDDAWRFRRREWLIQRGCTPDGSTFLAPVREWFEENGFRPGVRWIVPDGTKYRIQDFEPPEDNQRRRNRAIAVQCVRGFVPADRAEDVAEMPVVPEARYVPLYEGRMVHQFDHAMKAYISGEGRSAKWRDLGLHEKRLIPHYYVQEDRSRDIRAAFCRITGQTNERSFLAALVPECCPAGNSMAALSINVPSFDAHVAWLAASCSFAFDFLLRQKISTNLNYFYVESTPLVRPLTTSPEFKRLAELAARLVSITPEIQLGPPALDPRERAELRAEIDAIVSGLYNLTPAEFGYILTTFPLLDRDQPPLEGDYYVRFNKKGQPKPEPRSYVTRDTALLAYFRARGLAPPDDLADWYRREVRVDMDDETCPFRIGPIRSLEARVEAARRAGAIAYIPSQKKRWDPNGPYQPLEAATTLVE